VLTRSIAAGARTVRLVALLAATLGLTACGGLSQRAATLRSPIHAVLLADVHDARVHSALGGVVAPATTAGMVSLDLAMQRAEGNGIGFAGRMILGGSAAPSSLDASMLVGSKLFAGELGIGTRNGWDPDEAVGTFDIAYPIARFGVRSRANLGNSPFSAHLRAARYVGLPGETDEDFGPLDLTGWSAESGLSWTWQKFPVTANLGYRIERFRVYTHEQEVSSLYLGAGFLLGRR
jgi:hypothetical protein